MRKKIVIAICVGLIIIAYISRVYYVNATGYHLEIEKYNMGEVYEEDDFKISVKNIQVLSRDEFKNKFNTNHEFYPNMEIDYKIIELDLDVEYIGNKTENSFNDNYKIMSGSFRTGAVALEKINGSSNVIKKDEHKTMIRFGIIAEPTVTKTEYTNTDAFKFELVVKNYPKEVIMLCY